MQVPETDVTWTFSLTNVSENKSSSRTSIPAGSAWELIGVDGTNNGGLKPFPGFRRYKEFNPQSATNWSGSNPYLPGGVSNAHQCKVVDFWSFSVIAGSSTRVFGFVYLVRRANSQSPPTCNNFYDLMMEYYTLGAWQTPYVITENIAAADASILADAGTAVMSIETTGKSVYIFRRGNVPKVVYFTTTGTPVSSVTPVAIDAGPGKRINAIAYVNGAATPVEADFPTTLSATDGHASTSFPNPTDSVNNPPGSVVFCRFPTTGTPADVGNPISNIGTAPGLDAGSYSLAVQFEDTRSGRKSQMSSNVDMTYTTNAKRLFVDGSYDDRYFDTLNIYRSVRTNNAGGTFANGVLQLEAQITLSSYHTSSLPMRTGASLPSGANVKYFRYAYQLKDAALVMQDVFLDKPSYSATMPKGGAGALLDGTMLVGNISNTPNDLTGTGETRWSASGAESPELFSASSVYRPSNVGDAVTCFRRTGQILAGFTRNGIQIFSKQNGFIRVLGAHSGYGVTGPYAACTVGPVSYYMNYRGLKALYPDGRLDDVQSINQLVTDDWYSDVNGAQELSKISMAFDPATLCMYILNPSRQQAVQMWFSTGIVSELKDASFTKVTQGWWEDTDGQLVPRAMFLMNAPYPDAVTNTNFRPAVFMPCRTYDDKVYTPSKPVVAMLDASVNRAPSSTISIPLPDPIPNVAQFDAGCVNRYYDVLTFNSSLFDANESTNYRLIGMWIYQLSPITNPTTVRKARIVNATSSLITIATTSVSGSGITIVLDPVYLKWVGSPIRLSDSKDEDFIVKQPTSMGMIFSDYEAANQSPNLKYWVGSLYRNEEESPLLSYVPTKPDGTVVTDSVQAGDTPHWVAFGKHSYTGQWFFPSFETFLPNVKYRLVGAQVKGRMLPTDRTRRTL